jgi:hypothetical protein
MSMSFFKVLGPVLDNGIEFIAKSKNCSVEAVHELIIIEAANNAKEWRSDKVPNLNYIDPACRLAYLYVVAAAQASAFKHVIDSSLDLKNFILNVSKKEGVVKVCAFGAGPGTELLALAKFFQEFRQDEQVSVEFQLLDKVLEWQDTWLGIRDQIKHTYRTDYGAAKMRWPMLAEPIFTSIDITDIDSLHKYGQLWNQNVYVLNFVLSEIFEKNSKLIAFVAKIAEFAPSGARFVFIERKGTMWMERMSTIAKASKLILTPFEMSQKRMTNESPEDISRDADIFG